MQKKLIRAELLALALVTFLVVSSVLGARVMRTISDPWGSLLVSQAILQHQTVQLDAYPNVLDEYDYRVHQHDGHTYYYFPLGTSLFSLPFVAVANALGRDMYENEHVTQVVVSALLSGATFLLLFLLARSFLDNWRSLGLASIFWLGTSFSSTSGTALWSHDWASVFTLLALVPTLRAQIAGRCPPAVLVGGAAFCAYLCRPTLAFFCIALALFVASFHRKGSLQIIGTVTLLLVAFAAWSFGEFGQVLPDYYLPGRLSGGSFPEAFLGNLFSPARGLLVYSSFLLLPLLFFRQAHAAIRKNPAVLVLLLWPLAHLVAISCFPHWWGGWTYGARLMTDALPGLFVFFVLFVAQIEVRTNVLFRSLLTATIAFSVYVNWYQGLFNVYTEGWNAVPSIDENPRYLWDWEYPPFLHDEDRHFERLRAHWSRVVPVPTEGSA